MGCLLGQLLILSLLILLGYIIIQLFIINKIIYPTKYNHHIFYNYVPRTKQIHIHKEIK